VTQCNAGFFKQKWIRIFVGKTEGTEVNVEETGFENMDWTELTKI
jgi:hypothetical protein